MARRRGRSTGSLERAVTNVGRTLSALVFGILYLVVAFVLGWQVGSLLVSLFVLGMLAFWAVAALATKRPASNPWLYPLAFAGPALLVGLIAIRDNFTFLEIGLAALFGGGGGEYWARWRARTRRTL